MKSKKTLAKSLVFALALGTLPFTGFSISSVKAAGPVSALEPVSGLIKVEGTNNAPVVWGVAKKMKATPKKGKEKATQKKLNDKGWYEIKNLEEAFGGEIDAYSVAKGKAIDIVVIKKDKAGTQELGADDFTLLELKGPDKNFKVVYSADGKGLDMTDGKIAGETKDGYIAFFKSGANGKAEQFLPSGEDVQLKKGKNGTWKDLKFYFDSNAFTDDKADKRVASLVQNGAELSFRLKPAAGTTGWLSKEVKVKITKRPNAPKIKVDVHKDTVSIKKGMKYKVMLADQELQVETELTDANKNTFKDLKIKDKIESVDDGNKEQTIEVYAVGKGKKLSSKSAKIVLKRQSMPFKGTNLEEAGKDTLKNQGGGIVGNKDTNPDKDFVNLKLVTPYDPSKGAVLENLSTDTDYEFWIAYDNTDTTPKKWTTLKKTKDENKPTVVKLKTSDTKKEGTFKVSETGDSKIYIRKAGDNKSSSDVVTIGSTPLEVKLKMKKLEQAVKKKSGDDNDPTAVSNNASTFNAQFKNQLEYPIEVYVKDLVNKEAKPKLANVGKVDGVSVKVDAFDGSNDSTNGSKAIVTLNVDAKKVDAMDGKSLSFDFLVEGVKVKFTLTLKKNT